MNTRCLFCGLFLAALTIFAQAGDTPKPGDAKKVALNANKTLFLETLPGGGKRILIEAAVCQRDVPLELLMCRKPSKEHEAILHAEVDAREIHAALLVAGAKPGAVVQYQPKFVPPSGTRIKITLQYEKKPGQIVTVDAKKWVRNVKTRKALDVDWVFAGSQFFQDPDDKTRPPYYMANSGDVITVSNFTDAMLDLPIDSSKDNNDLSFECFTERIPEKGTKVTMILEPVLEKKK